MKEQKQEMKKRKKLERWAGALVIAGILLVLGGTSTEDARDKELPQQAKKELASPRTTFGMMGVGLASMLGGALLFNKAVKDSNSR